ncbi:hypothetical protein HGI09_35720 [Streptomyces collinus]|nr:hypothetical protein HGI10_28400 [Streptomyces collinus]UJA16222.1 hypothetical protein HGI09_35720 [Streptomyces collinus]
METTGKPGVRAGGPDDIPLVLGMLDSVVTWLVARGRTRQWGSGSWSGDPRAVALVERHVTGGSPGIAEADGGPAATLTLTDGPAPCLTPADEPERHIHLLARARRAPGRGTGAALLAHTAAETGRAGISLLRVDRCTGGDGGLVACYEHNGFVRTESFRHGADDRPGQVPARRVWRSPTRRALRALRAHRTPRAGAIGLSETQRARPSPLGETQRARPAPLSETQRARPAGSGEPRGPGAHAAVASRSRSRGTNRTCGWPRCQPTERRRPPTRARARPTEAAAAAEMRPPRAKPTRGP